jgi:hypothetical protein
MKGWNAFPRGFYAAQMGNSAMHYSAYPHMQLTISRYSYANIYVPIFIMAARVQT